MPRLLRRRSGLLTGQPGARVHGRPAYARGRIDVPTLALPRHLPLPELLAWAPSSAERSSPASPGSRSVSCSPQRPRDHREAGASTASANPPKAKLTSARSQCRSASRSENGRNGRRSLRGATRADSQAASEEGRADRRGSRRLRGRPGLHRRVQPRAGTRPQGWTKAPDPERSQGGAPEGEGTRRESRSRLLGCGAQD